MKTSQSSKKKLPTKKIKRAKTKNSGQEPSEIGPLRQSKFNIPEENKKLMGSGKRQDDN